MVIRRRTFYVRDPVLVVLTLAGWLLPHGRAQAQPGDFQLVEATIPEVHAAIRQGALTCRGLVEAYVERARAYSGRLSDRLVTADGARIREAPGAVRAGAPVGFKRETVAI
jgi:hypothetical protein